MKHLHIIFGRAACFSPLTLLILSPLFIVVEISKRVKNSTSIVQSETYFRKVGGPFCTNSSTVLVTSGPHAHQGTGRPWRGLSVPGHKLLEPVACRSNMPRSFATILSHPWIEMTSWKWRNSQWTKERRIKHFLCEDKGGRLTGVNTGHSPCLQPDKAQGSL